MYSIDTWSIFVDRHIHRKVNMSNILSSKEGSEPDLVLPTFNPSDSIFRKLANKESFSPDEVYKVVTAIEKKEASKKMIETFTTNLKVMAEEARLNDGSKKVEYTTSKSGKNAYEIRDSVLDKALEIVKLSPDTPQLSSVKILDEVLLIADRLYEFVENKREKKF